MNICRVTIAYPPRRCGWSHHAYHLSETQAALAHRVNVLHPQPALPAADRSATVEVTRVDLGPLASLWGRASGRLLFATLAGARILRRHARTRVDLIHGHGDVHEVVVLRRVARRLGVPLVMTVHSGLSRRPHYRRLAARVWPTVDGVIAVSQDLAADLVRLGVAPARLAVVTSGVDLNRFAPADVAGRAEARATLGIPNAVFVLAAVGRLTPTKGFDHLLAALDHLPDPRDLVVDIVGDGPLRERLQALASRRAGVRLVGEQPPARVALHLQAADAFALPAVDQAGVIEGTPTAVLEAMAAGLPVLTTDSGGAKDVIERVPGLTLVPQGDARALAEAIGRLRTDATLRQRIGRANRARVETRSWPKITAAVCGFYATVQR